jgi:hypothetical protein
MAVCHRDGVTGNVARLPLPSLVPAGDTTSGYRRSTAGDAEQVFGRGSRRVGRRDRPARRCADHTTPTGNEMRLYGISAADVEATVAEPAERRLISAATLEVHNGQVPIAT